MPASAIPPTPGDDSARVDAPALDQAARDAWGRLVAMLDEHEVVGAPAVATNMLVVLGALDVDALDALIGSAMRGTLLDDV